MLPFALAIFLSAFLLFQVQPLIGKYILPWFGGTPAVWTACMLFFQCLLLMGYAYGHFLVKRLAPRRQRRVHLGLMLAALALLLIAGAVWGVPLLPGPGWKPQGSDLPVLHILTLLGLGVGLPYLVLSSTSPLLQYWFNQAHPGREPYRLYALSNIGSMLALVTYPVLVEPFLPLSAQAKFWTAAFVLFVLSCGYCCWRATSQTQPEKVEAMADPSSGDSGAAGGPPSWGTRFCWLLLASCPSLLLLATTNQICQEVAVIPFLWVLPLSLYLLSFIICFDKASWYRRNIFMALLVVGVLLSLLGLFAGVDVRITWQVAFYSGTLFVAAMVCHGELVRLKPAPQHLTLFFLFVSIGGALGGVSAAIAAPLLFSGFWEFHFGLLTVCCLAWVVLWRDKSSWVYRRAAWPAAACLFLAVLMAQTVFSSEFDGGPFRALWHAAISWQNISCGIVLGVVVLLLSELTLRFSRSYAWSSLGLLFAVLIVVASLLLTQIRDTLLDSRLLIRNFYGVLSILEEDADDAEQHVLRLLHGRITHGLQFQAPEKRHILTTYYGIKSGIGLAFLNQRRQALAHSPATELRIGLVGLGAGTLAAYARRGDYLRVYEINPDVVALSSSVPPVFTYIADSEARKDIVLGDARISMEREAQQKQFQQFDVLAIDAFSSDSIPTHLLTSEAMALYLQHLSPTGIVGFHISNRYLNLKPVIFALADHFDLNAALIISERDDINYGAIWMLLSKSDGMLKNPLIWSASARRTADMGPDNLWTDDFSALWKCLK